MVSTTDTTANKTDVVLLSQSLESAEKDGFNPLIPQVLTIASVRRTRHSVWSGGERNRKKIGNGDQ